MWQSFVVDDQQKRYFAHRELRHPDYRFTLYDPQCSFCYIEIINKTNAVDRAESLNRHMIVAQQLDANHLNETLLRGTHDAASEYRFSDDKTNAEAGANNPKKVKLLVQMVYKQKDGKFFRYFWQLRQATQEEFCDALFKPALQSITEINSQICELRFALIEREKRPWQRPFDFQNFDTKYEESTSKANSLMRLSGTSTTLSPKRNGCKSSSKSALEELRILKLNLSSMCRHLAKQQPEALPPVVVEQEDIKLTLPITYICNCDYCRKQHQKEQQQKQEAREPQEQRRQRERRERREQREQREQREFREPRERRESREQREIREPRGQRGYSAGPNQRIVKKQHKYHEIQPNNGNTFRILHRNPKFQYRSESSSSSSSSDPENVQSRRRPRR